MYIYTRKNNIVGERSKPIPSRLNGRFSMWRGTAHTVMVYLVYGTVHTVMVYITLLHEVTRPVKKAIRAIYVRSTLRNATRANVYMLTLFMNLPVS